MNRGERRRIERDIQKLVKADGDRCSLCRAPFPHNSRTYYGRSTSGMAAIVGECCVNSLDAAIGSGLHLGKRYDALEKALGSPSRKGSSHADIERLVDGLQGYVAGIDDEARDAARRAGVRGTPGAINLLDAAWKTDDAAWFVAHPDRSHRLRPMFPGEGDSLPPEHLNTPQPPRHEIQMLVRQVEPGMRIRAPFGRNLDVPIPDIEAVIHALFDATFSGRGENRVVSVAEVAALAEKYGQLTRRF